MPRDGVTVIIIVMSHVLKDAMHTEVLMVDEEPQSPSDARFLEQLGESASLQHLLWICVADACHRLHRELHGVSPVKLKAAAAAVTSSAAVAAAAAAAESTVASKQQQQQQSEAPQQQYIAVPPHHNDVLDMLLAPAIAMDPMEARPHKAKLMQLAMHATIDFLVMSRDSSSSSSRARFGRVEQLPRVPVKMCAPLHRLVCEAVVLAPELKSMQSALCFQMALLDVYTQVRAWVRTWM
jgi:hypothetical protein